MESTLDASNMLGVIGSLTQAAPAPTRKARRSRVAATGRAARGISSADGSSSCQVAVGGKRTSVEYAQEAIVEAMSDTELVELVLAGDQNAFAVLVERYKDAVQNLSYRMLSNTTEAEDITQETFVRA